MAIQIPELRLLELIQGILLHVKRDVEQNAVSQQGLLYKIFGENINGKRSYFSEAKDVFSRGVDHPRKLNVHMFFPKDIKGAPTINIVLPGEQSQNNDIGVGESGESSNTIFTNSEYTPMYERRFQAQLLIIITSDNAQETLLIYHLLKAMLISIFDAQSFAGLENPVLSGKDLSIDQENNPPHLFTRALSIGFLNTVTVPRFFSSAEIGNFIITGRAVLSENENNNV